MPSSKRRRPLGGKTIVEAARRVADCSDPDVVTLRRTAQAPGTGR